MHYRKDDSTPCKPKNNTNFEIGQAVMVKNHTHYTFKLQYLMDYRGLKILNESVILFSFSIDLNITYSTKHMNSDILKFAMSENYIFFLLT